MRHWLALFLVPLVGCTLTPPVPLEKSTDPNIAKLSRPLSEGWDPPQLAIAPVRPTYLNRHVVIPRAWTRPPRETLALQARLQQVLRWGLYDCLPEKEQDYPEWPLVLEEPDPSLGAICTAAEDAGAQLVAQLDVLALRAAFVERELPWWPINAFLFWGIGIFPIVLVPDEEYEVEVLATFRILDARTQKVLFPFKESEREYRVRHRASFNDFQRGWSAESIFFLHEAFLVGGYEDFIAPFRELWPHVREKLLAQILEDLRQELPESLELEQDVLEKGDEAHSRTYALIIAAKDPPPPASLEAQPLDPLSANDDAAALKDHLIESGTVRREDIDYVVDKKSARTLIREALDRIGRRTRRLDRVLIYYSGFGTTDAAGDPRLVLDDGPLPLSELRTWCREKLEKNPSVVFLLDTSFGTQAADWGRNYRWPRDLEPGGPAPAADYLKVLGDAQLRWTVLAAAGGDQIASCSPEDGGRGIFTLHLLGGLKGAADGDRDGRVNIDELWSYMSPMVSDDAQILFPKRSLQTLQLWPDKAQGTLVGLARKK